MSHDPHEHDRSYTSAQVCDLTGITYRQLDYWARTGLIPDHAHGKGSGSRRAWSESDIVLVKRLRLASQLRTGTLADALASIDALYADLVPA